MTNTAMLEKIISESGYKKNYIAKVLGMTPYSLSRKINNVSEFSSSEIKGLCELLSIQELDEKEAIFFAG